MIAAASFGPYNKGEHQYATALWPEVPDNSITIVDKGFFAAGILIPLSREKQNRHWLIRRKSNIRGRLVERLDQGDELIEMEVSPEARKKDPTLPKTWVVRTIAYQRKGFRPQMLLTSLLDPKKYPAKEVIALYHERWELENSYDEIKTEMLDREESIRSKSPEAVKQELWGVLLAYNLVRLEMTRVAEEAGVAPLRISFVGALRLITDEWLWMAVTSPGAIPRRLRELRENLRSLVLPPRRPERSYRREVKIKMSNYPRKRRSSGENRA